MVLPSLGLHCFRVGRREYGAFVPLPAPQVPLGVGSDPDPDFWRAGVGGGGAGRGSPTSNPRFLPGWPHPNSRPKNCSTSGRCRRRVSQLPAHLCQTDLFAPFSLRATT
jgi:hypothetical protein